MQMKMNKENGTEEGEKVTWSGEARSWSSVVVEGGGASDWEERWQLLEFFPFSVQRSISSSPFLL